MTSIQTKGCSVTDYIMCDRSMYNKVKNFQTGEEENNIVSDHRFVSIEIEGSLDSKILTNLVNEDKVQERKIEEKRGWRRKIKNIEKFEKICEEEMKKWYEESEKKQDSEEIWQSWLEIHNKIAEEAVDRKKQYQKKKKKKIVEWDQEIFDAINEKNRLRREMGRIEGIEREEIVKEYKYWRSLVRKILNAKKKRKRDEMNEKLENLRGKDEKMYWKVLKNLAGIKKREESLPEEVRLGERVERDEKRKEVWNEAFSKLGKFDLEDKNFDKKEYIK
jgi:hypothetical protein